VLTTSLHDIWPTDQRDGLKNSHGLRPNRAEMEQDNLRTLTLPAGKAVVTIGVEDDGAGIPEEDLGRIFDPFYTTKTNGTGLGLPLVKLIANDNGGVVTVYNLKPGCRFTLILPAYLSEGETI
jgi:signal transduction histidine kinase